MTVCGRGGTGGFACHTLGTNRYLYSVLPPFVLYVVLYTAAHFISSPASVFQRVSLNGVRALRDSHTI